MSDAGVLFSSTQGTGEACRGAIEQLISLGESPAKKPFTAHYFDIQIHNPARAPRWLILPLSLPYEGKEEPAPGKGPIDHLTVNLLNGRGRAVTVTGGGPNGFHALYLPAGGRALLHELQILSAFSSPHKTAKIAVVVATDITIAGSSVTSLVRGQLLGDNDSESNLANDPRDQLSLAKPFTSGVAHTVLLSEECTAMSQVILKHEEH